MVAHIHAAAGQGVLVREVLETLLEPTRTEQGCLSYDFYLDADNPERFTFIEEWSSREALQAHLATPHIADALSRLDGKLADEPWIQVLNPR